MLVRKVAQNMKAYGGWQCGKARRSGLHNMPCACGDSAYKKKGGPKTTGEACMYLSR